MADERCETCRWWKSGTANPDLIAPLKPNREDDEGIRADNYGQCRRMPPTVTNREIERKRGKPLLLTITEFPDTPKDCFCGEWSDSARIPDVPLEDQKDV